MASLNDTAPASKTYKAVLFDLDETLICHAKSFRDLSDEAHAAYAERLPGIEADHFWDTMWAKATDLWMMMIDGALDGVTARRYTYINALRALEMDEALAEPLMDHFEGNMLASTSLFEESVPLLESLRAKGVRTGIVTNGYTSLQERKLVHHGLMDRVDFTLVSEEAGAHKPHPKIFHRALELAGVGADEALFVGDMPKMDIQGAHNVGMDSVLMDAGGKWESIRERGWRARNLPCGWRRWAACGPIWDCDSTWSLLEENGLFVVFSPLNFLHW